jgi:hypothetical protein
MAAKTTNSISPIGNLIDDYVARGVFRAAALPPEKSGSEAFSLIWFQNQSMTLMIDHRRSEARLLNVLPALSPRTAMDRQLRAWLRARADKKLPEHRRLNPTQLQAKLTNRAGHMQLAVASLKGDALFATRKLLHLANELYLDFLSAPERYHWIAETFELDPDNPRWP